jgi:flagellar motor component MotA
MFKKGIIMAHSKNRKLSVCRMLSTVMTSFLLLGSIVLGGGAGFFSMPCLMITCGMTFFLLLGVFGKAFLLFIPDAFLTLFTVSSSPNPTFADIAKTGSRFIIGTGVVGTLIGLIQMLRNLDDPSTIGAGMAVALLTSLYAIFMSEIVFAYLYKVYSVSEEDEKPNGTLPLKNIGIPVILLSWILISFFVTMIGFSNTETEELANPRNITSDSTLSTEGAPSVEK